MLRVWGYVLLVVCCALLFGCARSVTQYVTYGNQMVVEVTLRGTTEVGANRYFLVLASRSDYKIPLPPPDNISYEFIEPGTKPRIGLEADYYKKFYASWEGYCELEPGGYFLVKGPFILGQTNTRESIASPGTASNKIKFDFRLERIFGATIPSTIYFDFISVPWKVDSAKLPADHLATTNAYISKIAGSTQTIDGAANTAISAEADILKATVTIQ
jgi:hypothetical protein